MNELDKPRKPDAWMRRWAFNGEQPVKEKNNRGRMAWPKRFLFHEVTRHQCFPDDVPLYADEGQR